MHALHLPPDFETRGLPVRTRCVHADDELELAAPTGPRPSAAAAV
jgi:hypothetical protein